MKLLYTGAYGFLGRNVIPVLKESGFEVYTLGRKEGDYKVNLATKKPIFDQRFDVIVHAAGKAHTIPKNKSESQEFFDINVKGTQHLCESLENSPPKHFIFISTVAVYGKDFGTDISEDIELFGNTPYAKSKIEAEKYLQVWCKKWGVVLTILRPSLIAGINPPGNLGAMIKGLKSGLYFNIAGGKAKKSIVWAEDFADIIQIAITKKGGIFNVSDDIQPSFREISFKIAHTLNKSKPKNIPLFVAGLMAFVGDFLGERAPVNSLKLSKITQDLTFSNLKIKQEFGWKPTPVLEKL